MVGMPISALPTPAFLVDLDAFYHNSLLMSRRMGAQGVGWWVGVRGHRFFFFFFFLIYGYFNCFC